MAVFRRADTGKWVYRTVVKLPSGKTTRIFGTPAIDTKDAAMKAERDHIKRVLNPRIDVPTFGEWFNGRFWREWVQARKNKPSETESKRSIYDNHLAPTFADTPIDEIGVAEVAQFRGKLLSEKDAKGAQLRGEKTVNNILAVLSKALRYAVDVELLTRAPKVGLFKVERPEIEPWDFGEYALLLAAAKSYKPEWWMGVLLAGEAGMRVGEVKALRWSDVDLRASTLTVAQQVRHGHITTPKGRTRRVVPLTPLLARELAAGKRKAGYVVRTNDVGPAGDNPAEWAITAVCERAGLPVRKWHTLRHTFGTHAAMLGVNPFTLMTWMGHKGIAETLLYVHHAQAHARQIPRTVLEAAGTELQPDRRVVLQLGARGTGVAPKASATKKPKKKQAVG
jgi:integrase